MTPGCAMVAGPAGSDGAESKMDIGTVRVLIADDHPLVVGGLREAVLGATPGADIAVAHDFDSMAAALEAAPETDSCCSTSACRACGASPDCFSCDRSAPRHRS